MVKWPSCCLMCFILMFAPFLSPMVTAQRPSAGEGGSSVRTAYFRKPENDAANCLYFQLRVLGFRENYETFSQKLPDETQSLSLASMAKIGEEFGFRLLPVKLTMSELASVGSPVIVHYEDRGIGSGQFMVVLGMDKDQTIVDIIEGGFVTHCQMPQEQFRRHWSGYALTAQPTSAWELSVRRLAAALIGVVGSGWLARCVGRLWRREAGV